jgi:putative hydrolase of the HAD superfamily
MENNKIIKNIIFDLGNVLIPLQGEKASKIFWELMTDEARQLDISSFQSLDLFLEYETGKISTDKFLDSINPFFKHGVTNGDIMNAWDTILGDFPPEHVTLLKRLGEKYRLFALSNTNEMHVAKIETQIPEVNHIGDLFEKLYYSHMEGLRKPQSELYQRVLNENNLIPSETLFADDLFLNIETAKKLGIQTLHVTPDIELTKWFEEF